MKFPQHIERLCSRFFCRYPSLGSVYPKEDLTSILYQADRVFSRITGTGKGLNDLELREEVAQGLKAGKRFFLELEHLLSLVIPFTAEEHGFRMSLPGMDSDELQELAKRLWNLGSDGEESLFLAGTIMFHFHLYQSYDIMKRAILADPFLEQIPEEGLIDLLNDILDEYAVAVTDPLWEEPEEIEEPDAVVSLIPWYDYSLGPYYNRNIHHLMMTWRSGFFFLEASYVNEQGRFSTVRNEIWPGGNLSLDVSPPGNVIGFPGSEWFHAIPRAEQCLISLLNLSPRFLWKTPDLGELLFFPGTKKEELENLKWHTSPVGVLQKEFRIRKNEEVWRKWRILLREGLMIDPKTVLSIREPRKVFSSTQ